MTPMTHELKCWSEFFAAVQKWEKLFEIRHNDRNFKAGDTLWLREWNPATSEYTGASVRRKVSYITDFPDGLRDGYVCMGLADPGHQPTCHWCDEGRPWMPGQEGIQHIPLYGNSGEHSGAMCYKSAIYSSENGGRESNLSYGPCPRCGARAAGFLARKGMTLLVCTECHHEGPEATTDEDAVVKWLGPQPWPCPSKDPHLVFTRANGTVIPHVGASRYGCTANDRPYNCSDCPPVGYPTDKTRCVACPRHLSYDGGCGDTDCKSCKADAEAARIRHEFYQAMESNRAILDNTSRSALSTPQIPATDRATTEEE